MSPGIKEGKIMNRTWINRKNTLKEVLSETGFTYTGDEGWVSVYTRGDYQVWISNLNPDAWVRKGVEYIYNAEGVFVAQGPRFDDLTTFIYSLPANVPSMPVLDGQPPNEYAEYRAEQCKQCGEVGPWVNWEKDKNTDPNVTWGHDHLAKHPGHDKVYVYTVTRTNAQNLVV